MLRPLGWSDMVYEYDPVPPEHEGADWENATPSVQVESDGSVHSRSGVGSGVGSGTQSRVLDTTEEGAPYRKTPASRLRTRNW